MSEKKKHNPDLIKAGLAGAAIGLAGIAAVEAGTADGQTKTNELDLDNIELATEDEGQESGARDAAYYQKLIELGKERKAAKEKEGSPSLTIDFEQMGLDKEQLSGFPGSNVEFSGGLVDLPSVEMDARNWQAIESSNLEADFDKAVSEIHFDVDQTTVHAYFPESSSFVNPDNQFDLSFWVDTVKDEQGNVTAENLIASYNDTGVEVPILSAGAEGFDPIQANMAIRQQIQELLIPHLSVMQN